MNDDDDDILAAFAARHEGRCQICQGDIDEGDEVVRVDGDYVHADCAEEEDWAVEW